MNLESNYKAKQKQSFVWNMISSMLNAGMSALLLIVVIRVLGDKEGGIFSLAFSIAQLMLTIGYFDMRPCQVTDIEQKTAFKHYFTFRTVTCFAMIITSIIYVLIKNYTGEKLIVTLLLCLLKATDAFEDVMHGHIQQIGRLDIAARLQSIRIIITMISFATLLILSHNLIFTCVVTIGVSLITILILNIPVMNQFSSLRIDFNFSELSKLFMFCFPLFIGSYLNLYMGNAPKYAIDTYLSLEYQTYYNILFMPSYVVNLFSGFVFRPMLTPLSLRWSERNYKGYLKIIGLLLLWVFVLTLLAIGGFYFLGIPFLNILYGVNLSQFRSVLIILIVAGGIGASGTIFYYALTVMRNQRFLLVGYTLSAILAFFLSPVLVNRYGLIGAACDYLILIGFQQLIFIITFLISYKKSKVISN